MRGDLTLKILESIGNVAIGMAELFTVLANSGYGSSYGKLMYGLQNTGADFDYQAEKRALKKKYARMIYKLKQEGLIKLDKRNKIIILTQKGLARLSNLKNRPRTLSPRFKKEPGNKLIIVIFDIPEINKRQRAWLRRALVNLEFNMIQKSVWVGKIKLPEEFFKSLFELKINDFIEVFEITKSGSLKSIN